MEIHIKLRFNATMLDSTLSNATALKLGEQSCNEHSSSRSDEQGCRIRIIINTRLYRLLSRPLARLLQHRYPHLDGDQQERRLALR